MTIRAIKVNARADDARRDAGLDQCSMANRPITIVGDDPRVDILTVARSVSFDDAWPRSGQSRTLPIPGGLKPASHPPLVVRDATRINPSTASCSARTRGSSQAAVSTSPVRPACSIRSSRSPRAEAEIVPAADR